MAEDGASSGERARRLALDARLRVVDERLDALEAGGELADTVAGLHEAVDKLLDAAAKAPAPFCWDDLDPAEHTRRWVELETWIGDVLQTWHPTQAATLRPCWRKHRGAIAAVTAAWLAWTAAYRSPGRRGQDPADWMARHLPNLVTQLEGELGKAYCSIHPDTEETP